MLAISGRPVRVSFFDHRPPAHLRKQGSSSRTLHASTEYCPLRSALNPKIQSAFLGVRGPSSRHPPSASNAPSQFSSARCLAAHDVSHVLDGLLRGWLCGLISSHCHVQGSLFKGLIPRPQPVVLSHNLCPLVVRSSSATGSCPPAPLCQSAPSGPYSASESVTQ